MIYLVDNEIYGIKLGDIDIPGIYVGDTQIYPTDYGVLSAVTIDNLTWVNDVSYSGGTASSANCSFIVTAHYDSGKTRRVTNQATVTGSLVVPATTSDTRDNVGTLTLTASYEGFSDSGSVSVYQQAYVDSNMPLTFDILTDGSIFWAVSSNTSQAKTIEYSKNGGAWTSITATDWGTEIPVLSGDVVEFRGDNVKYGDRLDSKVHNYFSTTCQYNLKGNIMSLIDSQNFGSLTQFSSGTTSHFDRLFQNNTGLLNAENLILPATNLGQCSYLFMFQGCTNLTKAPKQVGTSATTWMFTGTYNYTCKGMFSGCTSLVSAPELPSLTTNYTCYEGMFQGCTSLTTAPELPATVLQSYCYNYMFDGCTNLNYVKCLAQSGFNNTAAIGNWLRNTSPTGTFVKKAGVTWPSGIPSGWTVEEV